MLEFFQLMDWSILQDIQGLRCGVLDTLMPLVTHLGDVGAVWLLAGAVLGVGLGFAALARSRAGSAASGSLKSF